MQEGARLRVRMLQALYRTRDKGETHTRSRMRHDGSPAFQQSI